MVGGLLVVFTDWGREGRCGFHGLVRRLVGLIGLVVGGGSGEVRRWLRLLVVWVLTWLLVVGLMNWLGLWLNCVVLVVQRLRLGQVLGSWRGVDRWIEDRWVEGRWTVGRWRSVIRWSFLVCRLRGWRNWSWMMSSSMGYTWNFGNCGRARNQ